MSEDATTVQSEQTEQTTQQTQTTEKEPTLEDIYATVAKEPEPSPQAHPAPAPSQPAATPQPTTVQVPDPYDADGMKSFLANQAKATQTLHAGLMQVAQYLNQAQVREATAALKSDIDSAVSKVNEVVKHPKPKVIEAMLEAEARENPTFKALWEKRGANPAAFSKALGVVAKRFAQDLEVRVDPALARAQEARRIAQGASATTTTEEEGQSGGEQLVGAEFDAWWQRQLGG